MPKISDQQCYNSPIPKLRHVRLSTQPHLLQKSLYQKANLHYRPQSTSELLDSEIPQTLGRTEYLLQYPKLQRKFGTPNIPRSIIKESKNDIYRIYRTQQILQLNKLQILREKKPILQERYRINGQLYESDCDGLWKIKKPINV